MDIKKYTSIANANRSEFELFKNTFFPVLMKWEGGEKLHKVSNDPGGWTKYGVAWNLQKKYFKNFNEFLNMSLEDVELWAFVNFYLKIKADKVPHEVKLYYIDMAYNMGAKQAIKLFQRCAGVKSDGLFGVITLAHSHKVTKKCLKYRRDRFYNRLATFKPHLKKFLRGWLNRSNDVYRVKY